MVLVKYLFLLKLKQKIIEVNNTRTVVNTIPKIFPILNADSNKSIRNQNKRMNQINT